MTQPLVSICVPTHNRADALKTTLPSILEQDYKALEILISDNASTDGTEALCRALAERDPRVRYVRHPKNIGLYGNHNFCLDSARGEFLSFFHDHDERDRRIVTLYVEFLQAHPRVGVVCSDWDLIDEQGTPLGRRAYGAREVTPGLEYIDETLRSGRSSVATPGAMIRRQALGEIRFDEHGAIGFGDFPVWFQMAEQHDIGHIPKTLWRWRQSGNAQSARTIESMAQDYSGNLSRYCDEHLARWPEHAKRVARWKKAIRCYLFWALAFEVGLYFRKDHRRPLRAQDRPTVFEIFGYQLTPEAFERTLTQLRHYRTGWLQHVAFAFICLSTQLKLTLPLRWATQNTALFRKLLRLSE